MATPYSRKLPADLVDAGGQVVNADHPDFGYTRDRAQLAAAVNRAGDSAAQTGYARIVYVPRGIWDLSDVLLIPSRVTLLLDPEATLRLTAPATTAGAHGAVQNAPGAHHVQIIGGTIDCQNVGAVGTHVKGITIKKCNHFLVSGVHVLNSRSYGIWINIGLAPYQPSSGYGVVENCYVENCEESIELLGVNGVTVQNNHIVLVDGRSGNGILVWTAELGDTCRDNHISGNVISGVGTGISIVAGAAENTLVGNDVRVTGPSSMGFYAGERCGGGNRVIGGHLFSRDFYAASIGLADDTWIQGVHMDGWRGGFYGGTGSTNVHVRDCRVHSRSDAGESNQAVYLAGAGGSVIGTEASLAGNTNVDLSGRCIRATSDAIISNNISRGGIMAGNRCIVTQNRLIDGRIELQGTLNICRQNILSGPGGGVLTFGGATNDIGDNVTAP